MARRLVPFEQRQNNAASGPHLFPATANVRFTENIQAQRAPDPPRASEFNTRPSRGRFFHGGNSLSRYIMREGFERATVRDGIAFKLGVSSMGGDMLAFRNPTGNSQAPPSKAWGDILDSVGQGGAW
jgi:hypothetical protein